ncbi:MULTISPECIES: hypothetical protein [Streptomyces]|uniref:NfeD-like C-terminal domain-containing protein n=1 Tax=Streptomyces canarius TaxID=285453 RepID=A0ABQ3CFL3_9ACTN|nr:hypothetical protein [Streptomyces canarius]GHA08770.1 hypothetical protein GCM10010345_11410 [Streptomyces canarius]
MSNHGTPLDIQVGDLVEGVASGSTHGSVIRVRVDREPWPGGVSSDGRDRTVLSDGRGVHMVDTDTIQIIERAQ